MLNKIFLIMVVTVFLFCNPVNGEIFTNGGFETGDLTGWTNTHNAYQYATTVSAGYANNSNYGLYLYIWGWWDGSVDAYNTIHQTVDLTNVDKIRFDLRKIEMYQYYYSQLRFDVSIDGNVLYSVEGSTGTFKRHEVNVSAYSGNQVIKFGIYNTPAGSDCRIKIYLDNIVSIAGETTPNYITWSTFPPDSWAKGNYSTLIISVPDTLDFDFYYKVPSNDDYVITPIQKSFLGRYYNVAEGCFYQDYIKTCYHAVHGNYSAKLIIEGSDSSETIKYIPYLDLDVDMPDVITIPVPEVFVDPPQWNVTIPDAYANVSWLTNYTDFWDGLGESINTTQYATVGLLLIPFDALNTSISGVYGYVDDASGMLQGFDHCALIVRAGWDVIPNEIQTIFIGSAALGIVVFIYHRRT